MKALILTPMKKIGTVLKHVFIEGNANNVELAQVAIPMIIITIVIILVFGHAPKY